MPLLSANLLLQSYGCLIIALGITFIRSPTSVLNSASLNIFGDSMRIRPATFIPLPGVNREIHEQTINPLSSLTRNGKYRLSTSERELLALIGGILMVAAISMMMLASSLSYSKSSILTGITTKGKTVRRASADVAETISSLVSHQNIFLLLSGVHVFAMGFVVLASYLTKESIGRAITGPDPSAWTLLSNQTTFIFALGDMLFWGYLYTAIKEERRQVLIIGQERREADDEDRVNSRD